MKNRKFFFISSSLKKMYTKYMDTLRKLQEKFLEMRQILNAIEEVQAPDVGALVFDCKKIQNTDYCTHPRS